MDSPVLVMEILKKSIKILWKNWKLIASLTLLYTVISSIFFSLYSIQSSGYIPRGVEYPLLLAYYNASFFFTISTISLSVLSYGDKTISVKKMISRVLKSSISPLLAGFFLMLLELAYIFCFVVLGSFLLLNSTIMSAILVILIAMDFYIWYLYSSIVYFLAIVFSVVEEDCLGCEALEEAGKILKGYRLQGFILNVPLYYIPVIVFQGFGFIWGYDTGLVITSPAIALSILSLSCLLKIFQSVTFTVFYFHCKKSHGEEIESRGGIDSVECDKMSAMPLINDVSEKV